MSIVTSPAFQNALSGLIAQKLLDDERADRWWSFFKSTDSQTEKFKPKLQRLFDGQRAEVLKKLNANPPKGLKAPGDKWLFNPKEWEPEFEKVAKPIVLGSIKEGGDAMISELGLAINFNETSPAVLDYVAKKLPKYSFEVNAFTLKQLRHEFAVALDGGEDIGQITKRVEKIFGFPEKWRNERIARTEIIGASNRGSFEGMRQSDVVKEKEWLSAFLPTSRQWHTDMDGEHVPLESAFSNGLLHPGDAGPADEVVNCVCSLVVHSFKE